VLNWVLVPTTLLLINVLSGLVCRLPSYQGSQTLFLVGGLNKHRAWDLRIGVARVLVNTCRHATIPGDLVL
jgi:hypothetical protein